MLSWDQDQDRGLQVSRPRPRPWYRDHNTVSHTRTAVRECCKGDDASQWENGKFDPFPRPNPLTDRQKNCTRDYVLDIYRHAKFSHDSPYARNCTSKCLLGFFFPGSSNGLQARPLNRFSRVISQTTRFHARMCLFGVGKQKFNIYTPQFPKNRHFGARFWLDSP